MEPEIRALWERYRETGDPDVREQLILNYAPLVKYVAGRVGVGLPDTIEHADLVSYGIFGLIDALDKFDLERGYKFETYAVSRIKGAIIDELRSVDWVPRSVRNKAKSIQRAMHQFEARLKRTPTDEELAEELGVSPDQLADMLSQVSMTSLVALDESFDLGEGDRIALVDTIEDDRTLMPEESFDRIEMRRLLGEVIERLSERERTIIALYYFEGLTLAQIGDILGVTESRVCQIHTKTMLSLRAKLTDKIAG